VTFTFPTPRTDTQLIEHCLRGYGVEVQIAWKNIKDQLP